MSTIENTKYELTDETKTLDDGTVVHRIRALRDIRGRCGRMNVRKGTLGGWVESEKNLADYGECWIADEAMARGSAQVLANAYMRHAAQAEGWSTVTGDALVAEESRVMNHAHVSGHARMFGDSAASGSARVQNMVTLEYGHRVGHSLHVLSFDTFTRNRFSGQLTKTVDGWSVQVGCLELDTVDELRQMLMTDTWIETTGVACDEAREEMLVVCDLMDARIRRVAAMEEKGLR